MKIVSQYKDYYDSAQGMGIDKTLVYVRKRKKISIEDNYVKLMINILKLGPQEGETRSYLNNRNKLNSFIIGFCGKIYPGVEVIIRKEIELKHTTRIIAKRIYAYNYDELVEILTKHKCKRELEDITEKTMSWGTNKRDCIRFFNSTNKASRFEKVFIDNKVPVFILSRHMNIVVGTEISIMGKKHPIIVNGGIVLNSRLADIDFYKNVDSFTAFQEISMYLGGVIPRDIPEMVEVSDKTQIEKKGFNEASFRKMPDTRQRKSKPGKIKKRH